MRWEQPQNHVVADDLSFHYLGIVTGEEEEGPDNPYACAVGLGPGSIMGMLCADGGFGIGFVVNVNSNSKDIVFIGAVVYCSSLIGQTQPVSGTSNLLLLRRDI